MRNSNYKRSFILKMGLLIIVITIVTSIFCYGYATSSKNNINSQKSQISYFDPFDLITIYLDMSENNQLNSSTDSQNTANSDVLVMKPPVRLPITPRSWSITSVVWVAKDTSYYPGNPPWNPTQ